MINVRELRVGNWIRNDRQDRDLEIGSVSGDLIYIEDNEHNYSPIPLTEEWLLRFGFEKDTLLEVETYSAKFGNRVTVAMEKQGYTDGSYGWHTVIEHNIGMGFSTLVLNPPEYVHELQNLIFSLTGEELMLKDPENIDT